MFNLSLADNERSNLRVKRYSLIPNVSNIAIKSEKSAHYNRVFVITELIMSDNQCNFSSFCQISVNISSDGKMSPNGHSASFVGKKL